MAFNNSATFPANISFGSRGGPGFSTSIIEGEGGGSERVARWPGAKRRYNVRYGIRTILDLNKVIDLYIVSQGPVIGFRYKDWSDFTTATDHISASVNTNVFLGTATGTSGNFQLRTQYVFGGQTVYRTISKPVSGTVTMARNGTNIASFSVDTATGLVSIASGLTAGESITGGCEFDVPVQFGAEVDEALSASIDNFNSGDLPDIPLVEMVGDTSSPERFYYGGGSTVTAQANFFVNFSLGRAVVFAPASTATSYSAFLPDPTDLELGGPYFFIFNGNGGGGNLVLKTYDGVTTIATLATGKSAVMLVYNDGTANKWSALAN